MNVIQLLKKHHRLGEVITNTAVAVMCGFLIWWFDGPVNDCMASILLGASMCAAIVQFPFAKSEERVVFYIDELEKVKRRNLELDIELDSCQRELEVANKVIEQLKSSAVALKENPLKSNRIVSDMTFAVRLRKYLLNSMVSDGIGHEERQYLLRTAEWLIRHQVKTVRRGTEEEKYLERLGLFEQETSDELQATSNELRVTINGTDGQIRLIKPDGDNKVAASQQKKGAPKNLKKKNTNRKNNKQ